jgi:hypothetical protein
MNAALSLLERQAAALAQQQTSVDFLVSVEPFLRALANEPRIAVHLEDLRDETIDRVRVLECTDAELVPELVELRRQLVKLRPDLDDSNMPQPTPDQNEQSWNDSLARFDAVAIADPEPLNYNGDGARAELLLEILNSKASVFGSKPPKKMEAWVVDLHNARERWGHATRWLKLSMRVSAGLALLRLEAVPRTLNPEPMIRQVGEDHHARMSKLLFRAISTEQQLYLAVHTDAIGDETRDLVKKHVADLRAGLARLTAELHRRIGMTRSRRALVSRFKQRTEWFHAHRFRTLADDEALPGGAEDRLTEEFARFLFDQGFNPLTKPLAAGLQPDLLDPSMRPAFYVEAKQYKRPEKRALTKALAQVLDTVGRLQSEAYPITEAFCIVFRRGGPRYLLPESVQAEGYRVYFTLIDIAPSEDSGSNQKHQPSLIVEADILDLTTFRPDD